MQRVALSAGSPATRAVAEVLGKGSVVFLHSRCGAAVAKGHCSINHIKAALPLIQPQLMVGLLRRVGEIDRAPLDVEYPIGRSARYRGINTARATRVSRAANPPQIIRALVLPVWEYTVVVGEPRQADVGKVCSRGRKLGIAIG